MGLEVDLIWNCGQNYNEVFSFDDMVHLIDKENVVICLYLDCCNDFTLKLLKKPKKNNREEKNNSRFGEKPQFTPNNEHHILRNIPLLSSWTRTIYNFLDLDPAIIMTPIHTTDRDSISNQYQETTTHQFRTD